jgi:hypothetical protein
MAKDTALLRGKVAKILNERDIALNIGSAQGVIKGMKFAIVGPTSQEIRDPETGEVLDVVDQLKALIQAKEVRERITICSTYKTPKLTPGGLFSTLYASNNLRTTQEVADSMENFTMLTLLVADENPINIGDRVKQVEDSAAPDSHQRIYITS